MNQISVVLFFFSSRRRHTRFDCDWSSDVCSSDLLRPSNRARCDGSASSPCSLASTTHWRSPWPHMSRCGATPSLTSTLRRSRCSPRCRGSVAPARAASSSGGRPVTRSEEHTSELQSQSKLECRLPLEIKNTYAYHRAALYI